MNVPAYLRKIDDEIREHRQHIALHQVEIARLEDARRVMIGLAEKDEAKANGQPVLAADEKPLLIMRDAKPAPAVAPPAEPPAKRAPPAKTEEERRARKLERDRRNYLKRKAAGKAPYDVRKAKQAVNRSETNRAGQRLRYEREARGEPSKAAVFRERVLTYMLAKPDEPRTFSDFRENILQPGESWKDLANGLHSLTKRGTVAAEQINGMQNSYRLIRGNA
jgi:hypothetical protein